MELWIMKRKGFFVSVVSFSILLICLLFTHSALASIRDSEFLEECKSYTLKQINDAFLDGVNVNAVSEVNEDTALMMAAGYNPDAEVVRALINAGARVERRNLRNVTPLMFAARYNKDKKAVDKIINYLIAAGDDINAIDNVGNTPLLWAVDSANLQAVETLLNLGADANIRNKNSERPFEKAQIMKEFKGTETIRKLSKVTN
jgi:ankyrin repeat protein